MESTHQPQDVHQSQVLAWQVNLVWNTSCIVFLINAHCTWVYTSVLFTSPSTYTHALSLSTLPFSHTHILHVSPSLSPSLPSPFSLSLYMHMVQTWDLMRLLYFGFTGFCTDFTATYGPDHYVVPVRINGSAIESLFGRFKFDAGGNLSAINYEAALSCIMTADAIARTCTDSYRNSELNVKGGKK